MILAKQTKDSLPASDSTKKQLDEAQLPYEGRAVIVCGGLVVSLSSSMTIIRHLSQLFLANQKHIQQVK